MRKIPHWMETYSPAESLDILRELAYSHAGEAGKPGIEIRKLVKAGDFRGLVEYEVDYELGLSAHQVYNLRQSLAFFSKLEELRIGIDKEAVAVQKFIEAETLCRETNEIYRLRREGGFFFPSHVEAVFYRAQQKIARVLGPVPQLSELKFRFGPGATTLTKKREASLREKFIAGLSCSEECFPIAKAILEQLPHLTSVASVQDRTDEDGEEWALVNIVIHDGKLDFAPKNAKTHRATVTEPVINGLLQLAQGDHMSARLAAFGIDLRDRTKNQRLALEGSLTGALATLDLKSASDTKARETVFDFLPLEWATFLAYGRSGHVTYKGQRMTMEKFSSMGNGFTFPLESLIFWAITKACCDEEETVSVYGDDIICPTHRVPQVVEALTCAGFIVNKEKSYSTGPFRESCGADYYKGINVRPYFQKKWVSPRTLFVLHNWYVRRGDVGRAEWVLNLLHPALHLFGPDGFGDGCLIGGSYNRRMKQKHRDNGYAGYMFDMFSVQGRRDIRPPLPGDHVLPLYSVYQRGDTPVLPKEVQRELRNLNEDDTIAMMVFKARYARGHGVMVGNLPIPDYKIEDGTTVKASSLPGDDGYRRVTIYTLGD